MCIGNHNKKEWNFVVLTIVSSLDYDERNLELLTIISLLDYEEGILSYLCRDGLSIEI